MFPGLQGCPARPLAHVQQGGGALRPPAVPPVRGDPAHHPAAPHPGADREEQRGAESESSDGDQEAD